MRMAETNNDTENPVNEVKLIEAQATQFEVLERLATVAGSCASVPLLLDEDGANTFRVSKPALNFSIQARYPNATLEEQTTIRNAALMDYVEATAPTIILTGACLSPAMQAVEKRIKAPGGLENFKFLFQL